MKNRSRFEWMELILGVLLILLGLLSIIHPAKILTGIVVVYGIVAILTGIADIFFYVKLEEYSGLNCVISLVTGILSIMAGFMLLVYPKAGLWIVAILLPVWLLAHCVSQLSMLGFIRRVSGPGSGTFTLAANIAGIVLALVMLVLPDITWMSLGLIVGIGLILLGLNSVTLAVKGLENDRFF